MSRAKGSHPISRPSRKGGVALTRETRVSGSSKRKQAAGDRKKAVVKEGTRKKLTDADVLAKEVSTFLRLCEAIDTPRAIACYMLASNGEWAQYLDLTMPDVLSLSFADDYLLTEMLSKNPRLPTGVDKTAVAMTKFFESEYQCYTTNRCFELYYDKPLQYSAELHTILSVQKIISDALGPLSRSRLERLSEDFKFGPGASSEVSGQNVLLSQKYVAPRGATLRLQPFVQSFTGCMDGPRKVLQGSRVITVPKNAKTDRTICIEPHINSFYQLGVGKMLRRTLRRLGLKPDDQERNRSMAKNAVANGYATIDLSMASDTVSYEVVKRVIPPDWFELLALGRSDFTLLPSGEWLRLEKFSSMGNGYTWELESLIFYAICRHLTDEDIGVFGDDLIVPIGIVDELFKTLELFGFSVNMKKSFWQGDFRESCGSDYVGSTPVRPFFFRRATRDLESLDHYFIYIANAIRRYANMRCGGYGCDIRFLPAWLYAKRRCGRYAITAVSDGCGDDGLVKNFDEATPSAASVRRKTPGWQGFVSVVARRRPVKSSRTSPEGAYLAALHLGTPDPGISRMEETVRGRLGKAALRTQKY